MLGELPALVINQLSCELTHGASRTGEPTRLLLGLYDGNSKIMGGICARERTSILRIGKKNWSIGQMDMRVTDRDTSWNASQSSLGVGSIWSDPML